MTASFFASITNTVFEPITNILNRLGVEPPQVLLLEGGGEDERLSLARYWAARCNCVNLRENNAPCLSCPVCRQIAAGESLDVLAYDGRISNKDDAENPGPVRAFTVRHARDLKRRLSEAPYGEGYRVVILMGTLSRDEAANALLKVLEEPSPQTRFVLLAPQREQMLPTLVSRSFCLTLPRQDHRLYDESVVEWEQSLAGFLRNGRDFLERVAAKNAVNADVAGRLLLACQKACINVLAGDSDNEARPLFAVFGEFDAHGLAACSRWLAEAQDALNYAVTPARVLQALAAKMFVLRDGASRFRHAIAKIQ